MAKKPIDITVAAQCDVPAPALDNASAVTLQLKADAGSDNFQVRLSGVSDNPRFTGVPWQLSKTAIDVANAIEGEGVQFSREMVESEVGDKQIVFHGEGNIKAAVARVVGEGLVAREQQESLLRAVGIEGQCLKQRLILNSSWRDKDDVPHPTTLMIERDIRGDRTHYDLSIKPTDSAIKLDSQAIYDALDGIMGIHVTDVFGSHKRFGARVTAESLRSLVSALDKTKLIGHVGAKAIIDGFADQLAQAR